MMKEEESAENYTRVPLPDRSKNEMFAIAHQLLGSTHIRVICEDGKSRLGRIPGKMRKKKWIRENELLIVRPWSFEDEKADIVHRYSKTQAVNLSRKGKLPPVIDIFSGMKIDEEAGETEGEDEG
ncbi:MAG: translation initiation factor eIF-1A [Thermoplasmata archaeon]